MTLTEGMIHVGMRRYLKKEGWTLVAGEYPGGSDDELYPLNIVDPIVARDQSPDPRRHSDGKLVPDLIAYKNGELLIVEAKPKYSISDKEKLIYLLNERIQDFYSALKRFCQEKKCLIGIDIMNLKLIPVLAFANVRRTYEEDEGFAHIYVKDISEARMVRF